MISSAHNAPLSELTPRAEYECGDFLAIYELVQGKVELSLLPKSKVAAVCQSRRFLETPEIMSQPRNCLPITARGEAVSLVQIKLAEDDLLGGFGAGRSMRRNQTVEGLRLAGQRIELQDGGGFVVRTLLMGKREFSCEHSLSYNPGQEGVSVETELRNLGLAPLTVEMLSSFALAGVSPFEEEDCIDRLALHRFRSSWSSEGRHEVRDIEDIHLERSWLGASVVSKRFGQVGTMPVRGWFPFAAIEDKVEEVIWAAQLACGGSWQMEVYRMADKVSLSGGLADREFGHWTKTVFPGESLTTPRAFLTVAASDMAGACQRLVRMQENRLCHLPSIENDLPIIFNEWCSSWGMPDPEYIRRTAALLRDLPVKYFVIDDGWAEKPLGEGQFNGDWVVDPGRFPHGLKPVADELRAMGFVPGLWFEFEVCTKGSRAFALTDHKLCRDGRTLQIGSRHFWDFTDEWTFDYLREKVIRRLADDGFGYLKVDYNDTIGLGCDHPDSLGEGLRQHVAGVHRFFDEIRRSLPDLVIEICSSGGHRLEPSFLERASMGSFSDAHECLEIPIIAANLHHLIPPRQNQIWAVLRGTDRPKRIHYLLAATFLGRACLSGDIPSLDSDQMALIRRYLEFYQRISHLIRQGETRVLRNLGKSWRNPRGWQAVVRTSRHEGRKEMLVVIHGVGECAGQLIGPIGLVGGDWSLIEELGAGIKRLSSRSLQFVMEEDFSTYVGHFQAAE